jgi:DinB superfamily
MEAQERQLVLGQLASSEARLLEIVKGLSPEQWSFRETPERWSIAENIEHIIALENFVTQEIAKAIQDAAQPDKKALAPAKESLVLGLANTRTTKMNAREAARPKGRWPDPVELIAELRKTRTRTMAFAAETKADLRDHFFPHIAFGDLDCYQWLVALGQHGFRHALQIEDIKAHPAFPVS